MRLMTKSTRPRGVLVFCHSVGVCKIDVHTIETINEPINLYSVTLKQELYFVVFQPLLILLFPYLRLCQLWFRWLGFLPNLVTTRSDYKR